MSKTKYSNAEMPLDPALAEVLPLPRGNNYFQTPAGLSGFFGETSDCRSEHRGNSLAWHAENDSGWACSQNPGGVARPPEPLRSACYRDKHYIDQPTSPVHDSGNAR